MRRLGRRRPPQRRLAFTLLWMLVLCLLAVHLDPRLRTTMTTVAVPPMVSAQRVAAEPHPTSVLYMHVFKTGGTSLEKMLRQCARRMCTLSQGRSSGWLGRSRRRRKEDIFRAPGMDVHMRTEAELCAAKEMYLPFTVWSRRESCRQATDAHEVSTCERIGRSPQSSEVLVRYPSLESVVRKFAFVAGHVRFRDLPPYMFRRDVRITSLRNSTTTWASSVIFTATHSRTRMRIQTVRQAHDLLVEKLDKLGPNAVYTGQLRWLCEGLPSEVSWGASNVKTEHERRALERCVERAKQNLRVFNVVGILERPKNTMALLHAHLGAVCDWSDHRPPKHENEAAVSTSAALAMLSDQHKAVLREYVRYDAQLYQEALRYHDELMRELGIGR